MVHSLALLNSLDHYLQLSHPNVTPPVLKLKPLRTRLRLSAQRPLHPEVSSSMASPFEELLRMLMLVYVVVVIGTLRGVRGRGVRDYTSY